MRKKIEKQALKLYPNKARIDPFKNINLLMREAYIKGALDFSHSTDIEIKDGRTLSVIIDGETVLQSTLK